MPTLSKLTPAAAAVIVGVAALLAVLVYLKVEGSQVAAVGFATTLVALFTTAQKPEVAAHLPGADTKATKPAAPTPAGDQDGPSPPKDEAH